jgi:hypothetical protein
MFFKIIVFALLVFGVFYVFGDAPIISDIKTGITGYVSFIPAKDSVFCSQTNTTCKEKFESDLKNCVKSNYIVDSEDSTIYYIISRSKYFCDINEKFKYSTDKTLVGKYSKCEIPYDMTSALLSDFSKVQKYCYGNIGQESSSKNSISSWI